jgi:hypothetical protein
MGLATANRRAFHDAKELLNNVAKSLSAEWNDEKMRQWSACSPALEKLLSSPSVLMSVKATDLSSDFTNTCTETRIITDMRPIFDDPKEIIVGATITQALRIEYHSPKGHMDITFAMDTSDIKQLQKHCEDALRKANITKDTMEKKLAIEILMPGEALE